MTVPPRLLGVLALAAAAAPFAVPAAASAAAGDKTIAQSFPVAAGLCAKVTVGTENKHLKLYATQVAADCATLQSEYTAAQSAVLLARTTIATQIASQRALTTAACPTPKDVRVTCVHARRTDRSAIFALQRQRVRFVRTYYTTTETSRDAFWKAIRALPGEHHIHPDVPIPVQSS
jgi:hypothetical protein